LPERALRCVISGRSGRRRRRWARPSGAAKEQGGKGPQSKASSGGQRAGQKRWSNPSVHRRHAQTRTVKEGGTKEAMSLIAKGGRDRGGWIGRRVKQQGGQCHNGNTARVTLATAPLLCLQGRQRHNCDDGNGARATQGMTPVSPRQRWHKCTITTTAMAPAPRRQQCTSRQPQGRQHCNGNDAQATMAMVSARQ
jgi:hypothetical protein